MTISNYAENKLLDAIFNNVSFAVANVYIKLHISDPGEDGTSGAAGHTGRVEMTCGSAASGATSNDNTISFTSLTANETISHVSAWDNSTAGNCLWTGSLAVSRAVLIGDTLTFAIGDIDVTLD